MNSHSDYGGACVIIDSSQIVLRQDRFLNVSHLCHVISPGAPEQVWRKYCDDGGRAFLRQLALIMSVPVSAILHNDQGQIWLHRVPAGHFVANLPRKYQPQCIRLFMEKLEARSSFEFERYRIDKQTELQTNLMKMYLDSESGYASDDSVRSSTIAISQRKQSVDSRCRTSSSKQVASIGGDADSDADSVSSSRSSASRVLGINSLRNSISSLIDKIRSSDQRSDGTED